MSQTLLLTLVIKLIQIVSFSESFWLIHYSESVWESFVHESDSTVHTVVIRLIQIVSLSLSESFWLIHYSESVRESLFTNQTPRFTL